MAHASRYIDNRTDRRVFRLLRALILYHEAEPETEPTERAAVQPDDLQQLDAERSATL